MRVSFWYRERYIIKSETKIWLAFMKKILVFAKIFFVPQGSLCMGVTLNSKKSIIQKKSAASQK